MARRQPAHQYQYQANVHVTCKYVGDSILVKVSGDTLAGAFMMDEIYRECTPGKARVGPGVGAMHVSASPEEIQKLASVIYRHTKTFPELTGEKQYNTGDSVMVTTVVTGISQKVVVDGQEVLFQIMHNNATDGYPYDLFVEKNLLLRYWAKRNNGPSERRTVYEVLGVSQSDDESTVKKAYRQLCVKWHPDVSKLPNARENFDAVQEAFQIVSNPRRRAMYNAGLRQELALAKSGAEQFPAITTGHVLLYATMNLGRLIVSSIVEWRPS